MLKPLILRADTGSISGYKQLIEKTIKILSKHYDLIVLPVFYEKNDCQGYKKINKKNWNCPELYLSPMSNDEHLSFLGDFTVKDNCFLYTMWESSRLTRYQKKECSPFSKILVPSKWNKECFDKDNFNVDVLPCFVDEEVYYEKTKKDDSSFSFLAGGSHLISNGNSKRKDFSMLLRVFRKIFKDKKNVKLKIKLSDCDYLRRPLFLDDKIEFFNYFNSEIDYAAFLGTCDCFVSVSKSEGWGFMQIESLATGKPLIAPLYSGVAEFANLENTFPLRFEEDIAFAAWGSGGGMWANVEEESLEEQLLNVYDKRDEIRHNSYKYSESVISKFSLKQYENNLINFLEKNYCLYQA